MSTAGSVRSGELGQYTPGSGKRDERSGKRLSVFRWKGIIPIALLVALAFTGWILLGEALARDSLSEAGTKALGAELDIGSVRIRSLATTIELRDIALADPFDPNRNLVEAGTLVFELEPRPLLEKKFVVKRLSIANVRAGTRRATPAQVVAGRGFASHAMTEVRRFVGQLDVPKLAFKNLGELKEVVLDPTQLQAVQAANALARRVDSTKARLETAYQSLRLRETLDSSSAVLARLQGTNLRTLGVDGARRAIADVRRAIARVDSARGRVDGLLTMTRRGVDSLQEGITAIDDARKEDYKFARNLLQLPTFEGPEISSALFGKVTIDRYQQAVYWASLARAHAPPGLLPRESEGPTRARLGGSTIHFATPSSYPRFLLRRANADVTVDAGPHKGQYAFAASDVTSDPAILGRPMLFALRRVSREREGVGSVDSLRATGSLDHIGRRREILNVNAAGVSLPLLSIPALPYRLDPGRGSSEMRFVLDGDRISGRWVIRSNELSWQTDSVRSRSLNMMETLVARVITGVRQLDLVADIGGTLREPTLAVRSNLDRQISERLRAVVGEEIAVAEKKVRAQVDRLVDEKSAPLKERIAEARAEGERRVSDARARLDEEKRKLNERVKSLSGRLLNIGLHQLRLAPRASES